MDETFLCIECGDVALTEPDSVCLECALALCDEDDTNWTDATAEEERHAAQV
jgi:hypothetical protein